MPPGIPWSAVTPADALVAAGVLARMAAATWAGGLPLVSAGCGRVRAAVAVGLAIAAWPAALAASTRPAPAGWSVVVVLVSEGLAGLALGLSAAAVFAAAAWAGGLAGGSTGVAWGGDGGDGADGEGIARLAWWLGLAGFVAAGGHEAVVAGLVDSVRTLPVAAVGAAPAREALTAGVVSMLSAGFALACSLALPAVAAVLAFQVAAGIAVRVAGVDPGQGLVPAAAALALLAAICLGTDSWIGGVAARGLPPLERCLHEIGP